MTVTIRPLADDDLDPVVALSLAAWSPVFDSFRTELGELVFQMVYPDWRAQQEEAVRSVCTSPDTDVWVAECDGRLAGFVAVRLGVEEGAVVAGEIEMMAVDPDYQRQGVGAALMDQAMHHLRAAGMPLAVIGTGGDPGHAPARALYEHAGFRPFPLTRYYLPLGEADRR